VEVAAYKRVGMEVVGSSAQNLAEAEYIVAAYMYLRLKQHTINENGKVTLLPLLNAPKIAIVTTEEAQKKLIEEILRTKCGWHPMLGVPVLGVKTLEEYLVQSRLEVADITLFSMTYTALTAPALLK